LPLYQFLSALINVFIGNGFYAGKLVSAGFGVGVCVLIYSVTLKLPAPHRRVAGFSGHRFESAAYLHSASAMTTCRMLSFLLASLYFCLQKRWVLAAVFAALRRTDAMESWMFFALIPAIQFFRERRISLARLRSSQSHRCFWLTFRGKPRETGSRVSRRAGNIMIGCSRESTLAIFLCRIFFVTARRYWFSADIVRADCGVRRRLVLSASPWLVAHVFRKTCARLSRRSFSSSATLGMIAAAI